MNSNITMESLILQKQDLRRQMIATRERISPEQAEQWSEQIVVQLLTSPLIQPRLDQSCSRIIGLYVAMRLEADLGSAWQPLREMGCHLSFPRMIMFDGRTDLEFHILPDSADADDFFTTSRFGVREPAASDGLSACDPDIILLPGLAFDAAGHRLGWGKGYYDHYLARRVKSGEQRQPVSIGVAYPFQMIIQVPASVQDIPVDYVLSPDGIIKTR